MQHSSGEPRAAFSVRVSVVNEGKRPLEIRDLLLAADTNDGQPIFYEPLFLWDWRQWIEDGDRPDKVGRAQKGQVPLPIQLKADEYYDFEYSILFLPLDKETMVEPLKHSAVKLRLYAFTDRQAGYIQIGEQVMEDGDIKALVDKAFSGVVSTVWKAKRARFIEGLQNRVIKGL